MQNIAKIGGFFFFIMFRGEPGASLTKVGLNRTNFKLSNQFYQFSI